MIVVKYENQGARCVCGGQVMFDGQGRYQLPIGIGFHPDGKCYADLRIWKGWIGDCEDCHKRVMAWTSKTVKSIAV